MQGLGNEGYSASKKPKTMMCYICGREYGSLSLPIHLKQCQDRFLMEEAKKPKNQRRPLPKPPQALGGGGSMTAEQLEAYNQDAFQVYNEEGLEKCFNCGRTFKSESLIVHQRVCKPDKPFKPLPGFVQDQKQIQKQQQSSSNSSQQQSKTHSQGFGSSQPPVRPKTLMCYICGREYGTKSLMIHIKQCKEMFLVQEGKKPRAERRKVPTTPRGLGELLSKDNISLQDVIDYNNGAFNKYNFEALVGCQNCGRTFKPEALVHHQKACSKENPFKPLGRQEQGEEQEQESQQLVECSKCGRKFAPDRLDKHQGVCKGTKVELKQQVQTTQNFNPKPNQQAPQMSQSTVPQVQKKQEQQVQTSQNFNPKPNQQAPQMSQSQVQKKQEENKSQQLKCYICSRQFPIGQIKQHANTCPNPNNIQAPPILNDIVKIQDPSQYLIDLYHQQIPPAQSPQQQLQKTFGDEKTKQQQEQSQTSAQSTDQTSGTYRKKFIPNLGKSSIPKQNAEAEDHNNSAIVDQQPDAEHEVQQVEYEEEQQKQEEQQEFHNQNGMEEQDAQDLIECFRCNRKFNADRIDKHEKVCKGQKVQKEQKQVKPVAQSAPKQPKEEPKWKKQHEEFVASIQYNRKLKEVENNGGDIRKLGPPPAGNYDHYINCPYCSRKFDPAAADRHIDICKNVMNKPKAVPQNKTNAGPQTQTNNFKIGTPQKAKLNYSDYSNASGGNMSENKRPQSRNLVATNKLVPQSEQISKKQPYQQTTGQFNQKPPQQYQNKLQYGGQSMLQVPQTSLYHGNKSTESRNPVVNGNTRNIFAAGQQKNDFQIKSSSSVKRHR